MYAIRSYYELIFSSSTYLEDNSFSTGHQNVNVYGLPEKCYEIRSEDAAVDVQIHRPIKSSTPKGQIVPQQKTVTPSDTVLTDTVEFFWLNEKIV